MVVAGEGDRTRRPRVEATLTEQWKPPGNGAADRHVAVPDQARPVKEGTRPWSGSAPTAAIPLPAEVGGCDRLGLDNVGELLE